MFINKPTISPGIELNNATITIDTISSNSGRMTDSFYMAFNSELTCIPSMIRKMFGEYYNNALCNVSTWAVAVWCLVHYVFEKLLNGLFKMQRYKEFMRSRLIRSLWYWGFYSGSLIYCGATLSHSEVELFNFRRMSVPSDRALPLQIVIGYTLISTFYQHSFLWESISNASNSFVCMWKYLFLAAVCAFSYTLRVTEICFTLTALIAISQILIESTRILYILLNKDSFVARIVLWANFIVSFSIFIAVHIIVIPLTFIVPLGFRTLSDYPNIPLICLLLCITLWLLMEFYVSMLFQFFDHWFYHSNKLNNSYRCDGDVLECSLFPVRNDDLYNITVLRKEIEEREKERMSKRKPKNRSMLIQTLKCMVALKKKLTHRKLVDSSDSDDSEKSESDRNKTEKENSDSEKVEDTDEDTEEEVNVIAPKRALSKSLMTDQDDDDDDDDEPLDNGIIIHDPVKDSDTVKHELIELEVEGDEKTSPVTDEIPSTHLSCKANINRQKQLEMGVGTTDLPSSRSISPESDCSRTDEDEEQDENNSEDSENPTNNVRVNLQGRECDK